MKIYCINKKYAQCSLLIDCCIVIAHLVTFSFGSVLQGELSRLGTVAALPFTDIIIACS